MPNRMIKEGEHYEQNKENDIRFIRAKLPNATPRELALIAAFIRGLGIVGWDDAEHHRPIQQEEKGGPNAL